MGFIEYLVLPSHPPRDTSASPSSACNDEELGRRRADKTHMGINLFLNLQGEEEEEEEEEGREGEREEVEGDE